MCGINGGWIAAGVNAELARQSLDTMQHRGPDDSGLLIDGEVFLGNRRLSIIDLEGGHQPIFNEDQSIAVVLNGEIYNYRELIPDLVSKGHVFRTKSDTEVLVHLYEEHGPAMCEFLRGMFAFAIWDARQRVIFIARDRFGKKPLYYSRFTGGLLFASELKALRVLARGVSETWSIDDRAIYDYLSLGFIPQPTTVYEQAQALPPASWMLFDGDSLRIGQYWALKFLPKQDLSYQEAQRRLRDLVAESVRLRLRSDTPLGVFLSSGLDSSVVAYEASRVIGESLQTFTVSVPDRAYDESEVAARTARFFGVRHTVLPLEISPLTELQKLVALYDQPYADESAIPSMAIARLAREHVKVILVGDGGDELFAGYRRYVAVKYGAALTRPPWNAVAKVARVLEHFAALQGRRTALGFGLRFLRGLPLRPGERYLAWTTDMLSPSAKERVWLRNTVRPTENGIESLFGDRGLSALDRQIHADIRLILLSALLVKMDLATMGASVEGRSPLLDHHLAEFAATLPDSFKIGRGRTKRVLRDAYTGCLPGEVIAGRKLGFEVPLESWLTHELRPVLMDTLAVPSAKVRTYVRGSFVEDLLARKGPENCNWAASVYALLMLELWLRDFA
ncbi:MAG: asparagine synthase (glutamine-hydrolyzing) [Desulfomonile tiedjei]|nr:asparagine synthase (glutamine-hydrolyzing) [Desulfomonile tiedjei]